MSLSTTNNRPLKFKAVMQRYDGVMYVSDGYGADSSFLSYLFDFENDRWDKFLETITTEQRFIELFPDEDEHLKGWTHIANIQYTGKNDKHNKEIYEGFLLQSFFDDGEIHEVIWHEESASFRVATYMDNLWGGSFGELFFMDDLHEDCNEIVGNIYENPELLKG